MLFNLCIENVALIKKADINFSEGFSVLTGETGAGKSILIGSVNMLLGERVGKDIVRHGEDYAYVEGLFYPGTDSKNELHSHDIELDEDGSLIVSRKLMSDGKNICKIAGKTVSVSTLREIGRNLINVHGQHDNQALLDSKCHISFLDAYCKRENCSIYEEYDSVYKEFISCQKDLEKLNIDENEKQRKIDILQFEINEISNASIVPGEEDDLKSKRTFIKDKENITKNLAGALSVLYENDEETAYNLVSQTSRLIDKINSDDSQELSEKINNILFSIEEIASDIRHRLDRINFDDISLDEIEERLDIIYKLKRKYGDSEEAVLQYCQNAQDELDSIIFSDKKKDELFEKSKKLYNNALSLANKISKIRWAGFERSKKELSNRFFCVDIIICLSIIKLLYHNKQKSTMFYL